MALAFNRDFDPVNDQPEMLAENLLRITAPNSGPYTFKGTNTYILGKESIAIIDPGPNDDGHLKTILDTLDGKSVDAIILTHTHLDHTPLTSRLQAETGAPTFSAGPHKPYRDLSTEELEILGRSADLAFTPDEILTNGMALKGSGWELETVLTPGHTANHAAFAIAGSEMLISGDHVMGWSTTIVAPPDGSMADYLRSLELLLRRPESRYFPGHGAEIPNAHSYVKGLKTHRIMREAAILEQLQCGLVDIAKIVETLYKTTPKKLHGAAAMTVLAHLEALIESKRVASNDATPSLQSQFFALKR